MRARTFVRHSFGYFTCLLFYIDHENAALDAYLVHASAAAIVEVPATVLTP